MVLPAVTAVSGHTLCRSAGDDDVQTLSDHSSSVLEPSVWCLQDWVLGITRASCGECPYLPDWLQHNSGISTLYMTLVTHSLGRYAAYTAGLHLIVALLQCCHNVTVNKQSELQY